MKMTHEQIAGLVERSIHMADGGEYGTTALADSRRKAWNYYLGRPRGDEDPDKSQVQSLDVADQVEHMLSQMMAAFTSDCPAEFEPDAPNDDSQAELESAACNKLLMEDNNGYGVLYESIKGALLFKNGIIKVCVTDEVMHETVTYDDLSAEEIRLLEASAPEDAIVETDDDMATVILDRERRKLVIEAVEPGNFMLTPDWHKQDLQDCPLVAERKFSRRSELLDMGFPKGKVNDLPAYTMDTRIDTIAKNIDETSGAIEGQTRSQDLIEWYEAYIMLPKNLNESSPQAERWRVCVSNATLLDKERVDIVPYVSGSAFIVPHRFWGLSIYDKLKEVQDAKTAALRQFTDNLAHGNNIRLYVKGDVNTEDLGVSAPGRHIRGGMASEVIPLIVPDLTAGSLGYLNYMDRIRSERGGSAIDLGSPESQLVNSQIGATGVAMVMGAQEMMAGFMARTLAETLVRRLFLLIHRTARESYRMPMMLRKADQWIPTNPAQWRPRTRINIKTGLTAGERARKSQALQQTLQTQMGLMQAGSTLVDQQNIYRTFMNWAKSAELDNPEQYAIHYESEKAQQMAQQQAQQAQQQQQMQMQLATLPEQVKLQIAQMQDATERAIAELKAEVEQMKVVGKATGDLELERIRAETRQSNNGADSRSDRPA